MRLIIGRIAVKECHTVLLAYSERRNPSYRHSAVRTYGHRKRPKLREPWPTKADCRLLPPRRRTSKRAFSAKEPTALRTSSRERAPRPRRFCSSTRLISWRETAPSVATIPSCRKSSGSPCRRSPESANQLRDLLCPRGDQPPRVSRSSDTGPVHTTDLNSLARPGRLQTDFGDAAAVQEGRLRSSFGQPKPG